MFVCTLTLPGQNPDADLSENRTEIGLQNLPNLYGEVLQTENSWSNIRKQAGALT